MDQPDIDPINFIESFITWFDSYPEPNSYRKKKEYFRLLLLVDPFPDLWFLHHFLNQSKKFYHFWISWLSEAYLILAMSKSMSENWRSEMKWGLTSFSVGQNPRWGSPIFRHMLYSICHMLYSIYRIYRIYNIWCGSRMNNPKFYGIVEARHERFYWQFQKTAHTMSIVWCRSGRYAPIV